MNVGIDTYFNPITMVDNQAHTMAEKNHTWTFYTVVSTHVISGTGFMPSYGLMFEREDGFRVYMPTDSQIMAPPQLETFYKKANVVYQDCETGFRSGVHAHIDDLKKLNSDIKSKLYLYHFDKEPEVTSGEFKGVLQAGDVHEY